MCALLRSVPLLLALISVLVTTQARGQDEARVLEEVRTCGELQRDSVRLACFDAIARAVAGGAPATTPPAATVAQPIAPRSTASAAAPPPQVSESFGRVAEPPPRASREPEGEELLSSVASLRELQLGRLEITLANGQVWRQVNTDRYALAVGHAVRIYPTRFGSYFRLTAEKLRGFVQVERVR